MTKIEVQMSGEVLQKLADLARLLEVQRKDDEPRMSAKMAAGITGDDLYLDRGMPDEDDREALVEADEELAIESEIAIHRTWRVAQHDLLAAEKLAEDACHSATQAALKQDALSIEQAHEFGFAPVDAATSAVEWARRGRERLQEGFMMLRRAADGGGW